MQHLKFNFVWRGVGQAALLLLFAATPVLAGSIPQPSKPDPLLDDGPTDACAARADYAAGTDANGHAVVPADVGAQHIAVPGQIAIPLGNSQQRAAGPYVSLDGKKLDALVNPPPCHPGTH
jgi:hypothetical protein